MPKEKESAEFKSVYEGFCALSEEEQSSMRGKIFARLCQGLAKNVRAEIKADRKALLNKIETSRKMVAQLKSVSTLSTEELETILAARKNAATK